MENELKGGSLTPRQWWLHDFLEREAMMMPSKWWTQDEIIEACNRPYEDGGYRYADKDGYKARNSLKSHEVCARITMDMQAVNDSAECDTIIMLRDAKYKMPTSVDEGMSYLKSTVLKRAAKGMSSFWSQYRKLDRDGQYKILANSGREMPEGDERGAERWTSAVVRMLGEEKKGGNENAEGKTAILR